MSWREFNTKCCFKIGSKVYPISVTTLDIRPVPILRGGDSVYTDISLQRRSGYQERTIWRDGRLSWTELGDDADRYMDLVTQLHISAGIDRIDFCPTYPFDPIYSIPDVLPVITEESTKDLWEMNARMRPAELEFKEVNPYPVFLRQVVRLTAAIGASKVILKWTPVKNAHGYEIRAADVEEGPFTLRTYDVPVYSLDDPNLPEFFVVDAPDREYDYYFVSPYIIRNGEKIYGQASNIAQGFSRSLVGILRVDNGNGTFNLIIDDPSSVQQLGDGKYRLTVPDVAVVRNGGKNQSDYVLESDNDFL